MSAPVLIPLKPEQLDDDQRKLYDAVLASPRAQGATRRLLVREDGSLTGPFDAWLRSPALGVHLEAAGMAFRTDAVLEAAPREVAVLVVARAWSADFEWWVHGMLARLSEVPQLVIDAIAAYRRPDFENEKCAAAHDVAYELVHRRRVDPETIEHAKSVLGERALVEVVSNVGFYQLVSGVLETFHPAPAQTDAEVVGPPPGPELAGIDLYSAASTTRAVRRLRPDPIPEATLRRIMLAATWAPSGANQQPWRVIAVRDPAKKKRLAELYEVEWSSYVKMRMANIPKELLAVAEKMFESGNYLAEHMGEAPVVNVFCFDPSQLAITDAELDRPSVVGGASLYPAVQNMLLACRAEGLGCVLTTLLCRREAEVRELLEIPAPWATHAFVPIGWPVGGGHGPISRRPVEEAVFEDRFGDALFEPPVENRS
jgi:nitroreductase/alkylhydroperoxidase family enzyme